MKSLVKGKIRRFGDITNTYLLRLMWLLCAVCVFLLFVLYKQGIDKFVLRLGHHVKTTNQDYCEINDKMMTSNTTKQFECNRNIGYLKTTRPFVALASFPGSGNTWTRELLEDLTGIYTGSIYPDILINMPGSHRCPWLGEVYIIKTHRARNYVSHPKCRRSKMKTSTSFDSAIFILRNPYDAFVSEFNRIEGGKVGLARPEQFNSKAWEIYVKNGIQRWRKMLLYWTVVFNKPCHVLVYERMSHSLCEELTKLAEFLQVEDFTQKINCLLSEDKNKYRRKKPDRLSKEKLFNENMRSRINKMIKMLSQNNKIAFLQQILQDYIL
ncbi:WSC domain-containing protein 1 [Mactra antiquata]